MNRKAEAGNQLMFFVYIFLMLIIGIGIVAGGVYFYGVERDGRKIDAELLNFQIKNCLIENYQSPDLFSKIYEYCRINREVLENAKLAFKICINVQNCLIEQGVVQEGASFESCGFIGAKVNSNYPYCAQTKIVLGGKSYNIVSSSNQVSREVSS